MFEATDSVKMIALDVTKQQKDDDNHEQEPNAAAGIVSPASAVAPSWERADQQQDQDY
jgi:hypothetical protein